MAYKIKTFRVSSTGMAYDYCVRAKSKHEAEKKFRKMFKKTLTGDEEIVFN
jgi:hypothetical protein